MRGGGRGSVPEDALDWPAGSGAMLAIRPTLVICDSLLRSSGAGLLPMEPGPAEAVAVAEGWRGAGGGMAPLVLGLGGLAASRCLAAVALAIFRAACAIR